MQTSLDTYREMNTPISRANLKSSLSNFHQRKTPLSAINAKDETSLANLNG